MLLTGGVRGPKGQVNIFLGIFIQTSLSFLLLFLKEEEKYIAIIGFPFPYSLLE